MKGALLYPLCLLPVVHSNNTCMCMHEIEGYNNQERIINWQCRKAHYYSRSLPSKIAALMKKHSGSYPNHMYALFPDHHM